MFHNSVRRVAVARALACAAIAVSILHAQPARPDVPRWRAGQSWRVEYLRSVPSPVAAPSAPASSPQRSLWDYRVVSMDAQVVRLQVVEQGGERRFELWFSPEPLTLRRVVKVAGSRQIEQVVHSTREPYLGWSPSDPLIFDWPALPATRTASESQFSNDDGQRCMETVNFTSPNKFETVMTFRKKVDAGYSEVRRTTQVWNENSPWWSTAEIQTEIVIDGKKSNEVNIRGRLIL